jgi:hypothetical protein
VDLEGLLYQQLPATAKDQQFPQEILEEVEQLQPRSLLIYQLMQQRPFA